MGLTTGRTGTAVRARGPARRFVLRTAFAVTVTAKAVSLTESVPYSVEKTCRPSAAARYKRSFSVTASQIPGTPF